MYHHVEVSHPSRVSSIARQCATCGSSCVQESRGRFGAEFVSGPHDMNTTRAFVLKFKLTHGLGALIWAVGGGTR